MVYFNIPRFQSKQQQNMHFGTGLEPCVGTLPKQFNLTLSSNLTITNYHIKKKILEATQRLLRKYWCEQETEWNIQSKCLQWDSMNNRISRYEWFSSCCYQTAMKFWCWMLKMLSTNLFQPDCHCLDHTWDYNTHHIHPVDFENLPDSHFTELQSVQPLHVTNVHRFTDVEPGHFIDPGLNGHHLPLAPSQVRP